MGTEPGPYETDALLWKMVCDLGKFEPIIARALMVHYQNNLTVQQTALRLVLALERALRASQDRYISHMAMCSSRPEVGHGGERS